ncbi:MAG: glycosyltransferase family 2 protein [Candidatus Pacebacteria bacterium]|nr:glycosyltransferase family 2 protein [Candidatus Paceibacterota bacterium]
MENNNKKVIGIIMTYNCAHLLEGAYEKIPKDVFDMLIVVDDGSKDNVAEVAKKLNVPFFPHEHGGYGVNLRYGLKKAVELGGEYMVEIHGDGQFKPEASREAVEKMKRDDLDFLIGSRFTDLKQPLKDGMPWPRYYANIGLSFIERLVLRIPWTEFHPGFRAYSKRLINKIDLNVGADDYLYSFQIIAFTAFVKGKCGEIPIRADYHGAHTSVNYRKAAINSFQEMWVLVQYVFAKFGLKSGVFK